MAKRKSRAQAPSRSKRKPLPTGNKCANPDLQLAIVPASVANLVTDTGFRLPPGWTVQEVPRPERPKIDRYFFEPGTGAKFRSLKDVERHLKGLPVTRVYRSGSDNCLQSPTRKMNRGGKMLNKPEEEEENLQQWAITPVADNADDNQLPDGWVVEEVPRAGCGYSDKYYFEPGTGKKFRSLVSVHKYLRELNSENAPLSKMFKLQPKPSKASREESLFGSVPAKVNWVLANHKGDAWDPFIGDDSVSESLKEQWAKRLTSFLDNSS